MKSPLSLIPLFAMLCILATATAFAQSSAFTDPRDGKKYKVVKIGKQTWMAENLNYNASGSKCYDNDSANCEKYGRLYKWATAMNIDEKFNEEKWDGSNEKHSGICPKGWHLPTKAEWEVMTAYIGGASTEGKKLKAKNGWHDNGNGTDDYGFNALPGGQFSNLGDSFDYVGEDGYWLSASERNSNAHHGGMYVYCRGIFHDRDQAYWGGTFKSYLYSVRCIQN